MINNSDRIGDYQVTVIARKHRVASFQCPALDDARAEAQRIRTDREKRKLPTITATARQIIGRTRSGFTFGEPIAV